MLQWFYGEFGFAGSILISLLLFLSFVFWFSGLAGIAGLPDKNATKNIKIVLAVLIPVFPIGWLILDMYRQQRIIKGHKQNS
jgi:hypothetical protein